MEQKMSFGGENDESENQDECSSMPSSQGSQGSDDIFEAPKFNFTNWSSNNTSYMDFLSLLPPSSMFTPHHQESRIGKIKISLSHKKKRLKATSEYNIGRSSHQSYNKLKKAVIANDHGAVAHLLSEGADPNLVDDKQRSPLHFAAANGSAEIVKELLNNGANPNLRDAIGNTPLHLAICGNRIQAIILLLKGGTDLLSTDQYGKTPLHVAMSRLRVILSYPNLSTVQLKAEAETIRELVKIYMDRSNRSDTSVDSLVGLCETCLKVDDKDTVDQGQLLNLFTEMNIQDNVT